MSWLPDAHVAPNIQGRPDLYELENLAADREQRIEAHMQFVADFEASLLLDLGAGAGFHAARYAERAEHVFAMEPHGLSRQLAMKRCVDAQLENVSVMAGSAEHIMLPAHSVDIAHARFAYFWGSGCEAGLAELERVIKPGGVAFIIDNDLRTGTFAKWLARSSYTPIHDAEARDAFWRSQGFEITKILSAWDFEQRSQLEEVVANEFPAALVPELLAEHTGLSISYGYSVMHRRY